MNTTPHKQFVHAHFIEHKTQLCTNHIHSGCCGCYDVMYTNANSGRIHHPLTLLLLMPYLVALFTIKTSVLPT